MAKKHKTKAVSKKFFYIIIGTQTAIFAVIISALFVFTSIRTQNWNLPSTEMVHILDSAISSSTHEASLNPDNSYQYIPEAKLRFKTVNNQKLLYFYNQEDLENKVKGSITITSETIKRASITELYQYNQGSIPEGQQLFDRVPGVQNCNKIFVLSYDDSITSYHGEEYSLQETRDIGNTRLYLWVHTGALCNAAGNTDSVDELKQMLLSAELY